MAKHKGSSELLDRFANKISRHLIQLMGILIALSTLGISYDVVVEKAQALLEKIIANHALVLADPQPTIKMNKLGDSAGNFICRPWSKTADSWSVYWNITKQVKREFEANGLKFPYPQQDVHLHQTK